MQKIVHVYVVVAVSLIISSVMAAVVETTIPSVTPDQYYMVFINRTWIETSPSSFPNHHKRQEEVVEVTVDTIQDLILSHTETYEDPKVVEEMAQASQLRKRGETGPSSPQYLMDYGDSDLVYPISFNLDSDTSIVMAYLSKDLAQTVTTLANVLACEPNRPLTYFKSSTYYNETAIIQEANWEKLGVRRNSDLHLSLLSQGKFKYDRVSLYDTNFYYPSSAGEDIDLFIFDSGFNFRHSEFTQNPHRTVKCALMISEGRVFLPYADDYCYGTSPDDHGSGVADNAAGKNHGVAPQANIYGIYLEELNEANTIAGLEYISRYLFRPNHAVFNFSFGGYYSLDEYSQAIFYEQYLINMLAANGAIFVAAAGNDNELVFNDQTKEIVFPCSLNNVICVGGMENMDPTAPYSLFMNPSNYKKANLSNYGPFVTLYAPFYTRIAFQNAQSKNVDYLVSGTSYSAALVTGIVASVMSEHPDFLHTTYSMLYYLSQLSMDHTLTGIPSGYPNLLVNNGKRVVYSMDSIYYGCGVLAGNQSCPRSKCCSKYGYCGRTADYCDTGCQSEFGICNN